MRASCDTFSTHSLAVKPVGWDKTTGRLRSLSRYMLSRHTFSAGWGVGVGSSAWPGLAIHAATTITSAPKINTLARILITPSAAHILCTSLRHRQAGGATGPAIG